MSTADGYDYQSIKELGQELGRSIETLVALSAQNDPFYIQPGRRAAAEWFARVWQEQECGPGTHVRAIHYRLISHVGGYIGADEKPYLNTDRCYKNLSLASQDARYLGLVPIGHFDDRRNDEPIEFLADRQSDPWLHISRNFGPTEFEETVDRELPEHPQIYLMAPEINQRYHVELWCEKSTMNDILIRLAERYHLNVVTASGEMSITHCWRLVQRALASKRPVRILYISDFDPAGRGMPVSCARKIEFFIRRDKLDLDVQVRPVALTPEQCVEFRLPRTPIKDEARAERFEMQHGEGATELDALEALHPGALRQILEHEIRRYYDVDLATQIARVARDFTESLDDVNAYVTGQYADQADLLLARHEDLIDQCNAALAEFREPIEEVELEYRRVQDAIRRDIENEASNLPEVEWPEPKSGDEDSDPLFDSARDYLDQVARYKVHQGKSTTERRPAHVLRRIADQYAERRRARRKTAGTAKK